MKPQKAKKSVLKCVNCTKSQWTLMMVEIGIRHRSHQYLLVCDYCESEYKFTK